MSNIDINPISIHDSAGPDGSIIREINSRTIKLQTKTINPSFSAELIEPDIGYDGFNQIIISSSSEDSTISIINQQDFIGFEFNGVHSSELGIVRVSGGDRYNQQLFPEIKDKIVEVPGLDGSYYFGSDYGPVQFDIDIAFDNLNEKQFRKLQQVFGTKEIKKLIFDEYPYKYYMAKLSNPIELSYVCFDVQRKRKYSDVYSIVDSTDLPNGIRKNIEDNNLHKKEKIDPWVYIEETERIYKGEGKINFICYFPFAKSNFKVLPSSEQQYYKGSKNWAISSGLLSGDNYINRSIDQFININNNKGFKVYNPGDLPVGFRLYCSFGAAKTLTIKYYEDPNLSGNDYDAILVIDTITKQGSDKGIIIDTNLGLIYGVPQEPNTITNNIGVTDIITSSNLYNKYVVSGTFFKIKPHNNTLDYSKILITATNGDSNIISNVQIFYDYLYF